MWEWCVNMCVCAWCVYMCVCVCVCVYACMVCVHGVCMCVCAHGIVDSVTVYTCMLIALLNYKLHSLQEIHFLTGC